MADLVLCPGCGRPGRIERDPLTGDESIRCDSSYDNCDERPPWEDLIPFEANEYEAREHVLEMRREEWEHKLADWRGDR